MNATEWEVMLKARDMLVAAPHGRKADVTAQVARMLQCSTATVYRRLEAAGLDLGRKRRSDAGSAAVDLDELKLLGATLMASRRDNDKQLWSTRRAVSALQANGLLSSELSAGRLAEVLKAQGLHVEQLARPHATTALRSPHPNWLWQIDSSTSVLYKDKTGRMRSMSTDEFYKNKPQNFARVVNDLITRYLAVDHASGAFRGRYYLGGESAENLIDFFIHAVTKGLSPMHGVPLHVYTDQGSGNKAGLWLNFARNLDVKLLRHEVGRANATGSVEKHGDLWERGFEGGFPFMDPEQITLDWLNAAGEEWAAQFCASERHSRHGMTRDAAWLLIRQEQLRVPESVALLRELASAEPQTRRVSNTLTISFRVRGEARSYSVRGLAGAGPAEKLTVRINPYRAPAIDVLVGTDAEGREQWQLVEPELVDQYGFPLDAPVLGEGFRPAANTVLDDNRHELLRRTYRQEGAPLPTLEEAQRLRKAHAQALGGALDPMADVRATERPTYMPRRGTPLDTPAAAAAGGRRVSAVLLTPVEASKRIKALIPAEHFGPQVYAWLVQRFAEGVPEDQLDGLAQQFVPAAADDQAQPGQGLRVVAGGGAR